MLRELDSGLSGPGSSCGRVGITLSSGARHLLTFMSLSSPRWIIEYGWINCWWGTLWWTSISSTETFYAFKLNKPGLGQLNSLASSQTSWPMRCLLQKLPPRWQRRLGKFSIVVRKMGHSEGVTWNWKQKRFIMTLVMANWDSFERRTEKWVLIKESMKIILQEPLKIVHHKNNLKLKTANT